MTLLGQLQELPLGVPLVSGFGSNFIRLVFQVKVLEIGPVWFVTVYKLMLHSVLPVQETIFYWKPPEKTLHQNFLSGLKIYGSDGLKI